MIQRIQTIWFLLASACAFLSLKMPFYIGTNKNHIASYQLNGMENIFITIITCVVGALAFVTIFLFKKRRRQVRLSFLGILVELVLLVLYYLEIKTFTEGTFALTALLQSCVILFYLLALRGIHKDINLVRSSDRLR